MVEMMGLVLGTDLVKGDRFSVPFSERIKPESTFEVADIDTSLIVANEIGGKGLCVLGPHDQILLYPTVITP